MTLPNSKLGKVFAYSLNHETTFKHVLLDGKFLSILALSLVVLIGLVFGAFYLFDEDEDLPC